MQQLTLKYSISRSSCGSVRELGGVSSALNTFPAPQVHTLSPSIVRQPINAKHQLSAARAIQMGLYKCSVEEFHHGAPSMTEVASR